MTTIAAVQGASWAVLGYDSNVAEDGGGRRYTLPKTSGKVFRNGGYLMGVAGDLRAINVLANNFVPPDPGKNRGIKLDKFMSSRFVPSMKVCFDNNFYGKDNEHSSTVMVVVNGVIYEVGNNYDCVRDDHGLYAIGSGAEYALGALTAYDLTGRRTIKAARENVDNAVNIAITYDSGSAPPVNIEMQHWRSDGH